MRLTTFVHDGPAPTGRTGYSQGHERVYDLNRLDPRLPADMLAFLEAGQAALTLAAASAGRRGAGSGPEPD